MQKQEGYDEKRQGSNLISDNAKIIRSITYCQFQNKNKKICVQVKIHSIVVCTNYQITMDAS